MSTVEVPDQPTVCLRIGHSSITFDERGELLETVEYDYDGDPDWSAAAICDGRGGGGEEGYRLLHQSLTSAERNAELIGYTIRRVAV